MYSVGLLDPPKRASGPLDKMPSYSKKFSWVSKIHFEKWKNTYVFLVSSSGKLILPCEVFEDLCCNGYGTGSKAAFSAFNLFTSLSTEQAK